MDNAKQAADALYLPDLVSRLSELLTPQLVAYITYTEDMTARVRRWQQGTWRPNPEQERRLRATYQIVLYLREFEHDDVIRAFFIGADPGLDDTSPAQAIHDGRYNDARSAAVRMIAGTYA
jgi:hypothetical protein